MSTLRTLVGIALSTAALALALAAAGCSSQGQNSQVLVDVDAEPGVRAMANTLIVRVYGGRRGEMVPSTVVFERPFDVSAGTGRWPRRVALAPMVRGDLQSIYRFEAAAYREGSPTAESVPVATVRLISGYSRDQTLTVRLVLQDACIGVLCGLDETCDRGGCIDAEVPVEELGQDGGTVGMDGGVPGDGGTPCDPAECDDGFSCTSDFCNADGTCGHSTDDSACDDGMECTMDRCLGAGGDANGCSFEPRTGEPCTSDGDFCTGVETCSAAGLCVSSGDPCPATTTCVGGACTGCMSNADCPSPITTPGVCTYLDGCAEAGTAMDVVTTYTCNTSGTCVGSDTTTPRTCTRDTDGLMCGTTTYTTWTCGGFTSTCDESGTETRTRVTRACVAGTCTPTGTPETRSCVRDTDGAGCDDGDGCTRPDVCRSGACSPGTDACGDAGGPICSDAGGCDDLRSCTVDSCAGGTFCQHMPDDALCPPPLDACVVARCAPADPSADGFSGCVEDRSGCGDGGVGDECVDARDCDDGNDCTFDDCIFPIASPSVCDHYDMCFDDGGTISVDSGFGPPMFDGGT